MPGIGIIGGRFGGGGGAAGGSISVAVSDASPNVGETITITATPSGFTPDSYLFFAFNGTELKFIAEQASNTFDWTISAMDTGTYDVYVLGVENGSPDATAYGTVEIEVSSNFLLDTVEGAGANFALAFYRLRAGFSDPIAIIRRSSDNAQKSFYFDSNNVLSLNSEDGNGTSLSSWIGSDDGYLVTANSQAVTLNVMTASAAAEQQLIIDNGVMVDIYGVPATLGHQDRYTLATAVTAKSVFAVAQNDDFEDANYVVSGAGVGLHWGGRYQSVTGITFVSTTNVFKSTVEDFDPHIASALVDSGLYVDGVLLVTGTMSDLYLTTVGGQPTGGNSIKGKMAVVITYPTDKTSDRAAIEANINANFSTSLLP